VGRLLRRVARRLAGPPPRPSAAAAPPPPLPDGALDCTIARNEHGAYAVPASSAHRPAAQTVLRGDVWERETVDLLRHADPAGDIVHAGTFFGDFLPAIARSRDDGATVWAFEPSSENHRCAQVTVVLNGLHNVVLHHAGLDASSGTGRLAVQSADGLALGGGSHLVSGAEQAGATEQVPLLAIDDVVPANRHVAVVQLDVEGHEKAALLGAVRTIERCRPLLVLESPPDAAWFAEHFAELGYTVTGRVADNSVLTPA
jgi:FkbM family methyltransferase